MSDNGKHVYRELILDYANEWIIPGADDDKGHNVTEKTPLPKTWIAQMDRMVKFKKYPYINRGQIVRHALYMLFTWIDTIPDKQLPTSDLKRIESMRNLMIEETMLTGFNDVMIELGKRVAYCKSKKLPRRAARHVLDILRIARELKDEDWRNHYEQRILNEYKELLDSIDDIELLYKEKK
ncbi:MAG: hypothetical protein ACFFDY_01170 [Candidatus Thorarchaeota archaeon]